MPAIDDIGPAQAAAALGSAASSREWLASRVIAPRWYHPALGTCAGALIAIAETRDWTVFFWAVAGYTVACGTLQWVNQRRAGVWIRNFQGLRGLVFAMEALALGGLVGIACWLELGLDVHGAFLVAGVLAVPIVVGFGMATDGLIRTQLQAAS
jgi:hypothetical protein